MRDLPSSMPSPSPAPESAPSDGSPRAPASNPAPGADPSDAADPSNAADPPAPAAIDVGAGVAELGAELREGATAAIQSFADATVAPLQAGLGRRAGFLRGALVAHLASTATAALAALDARQPDWQLYLWAGAGGVILVGNSVRWRAESGWLRRLIGTALALFVTLAWGALLLDRAIAGVLPDAAGVLMPAPGFWAPVALLALCGALLIAHFAVSLRTLLPKAPPT